MANEVLFERRDHVASIIINRPAARNALTRGMCADLAAAITAVRSDPDTRVLVLRGQGPDFTVGADLREMADLPRVAASERGARVAAMARELAWPIFLGLHEIEQPVIAAVRGHVIGVGVQFVLSADLAIASETCRFLLPMARLGHPVDHGESFTMPRKLGLRRAMQMLLLAETVGAMDAERFGMVNWVVPDAELDDRAVDIAQRIAAGAPVALRKMKALLRESADRSVHEQYAAEAEALGICAGTADFAEAIAAFLEKRSPVFSGR